MTSFYFVETYEQASADATYKGVSSWIWFPTKESMDAKNPLDYEAVYLKTGINEIEAEFARIMRENIPTC